jgi:large subunit ribosomal protein L21
MYAIVEIAGQQFKVEEGKKIFVHRMETAEGENVEFEKVLLIDNDGAITIGEPVIENTVVEGKVLSHPRGDKVIIFKKKRRKGYQKRSGHRQDLTQVEILSIGARGEAKKKAPAKAKAKAETEVKAEAKVEAKAETKKAPVKKAAATKEKSEKKPAEKKAPAAKSAKKPAKE